MPKKLLTIEEFIDRAVLVHGDKYDYSDTIYINSKDKLSIVCPIHGPFLQVPSSHWGGNGCPHCIGNIRKTKELFVKQSINVHGNKYNYDDVEYKNIKEKVKIFCIKHGEFWQIPKHHLNGCGCPKCANDKTSLINSKNQLSWSLSNWKSSAKKSKEFDSFKVYFIKCWNDNEMFYKIGRTFTTVGKRFCSSKSMPYKWVLVKQIEGDAETIYNLENELKRQNKIFKYAPKLKFDGMHECFSEIDINGK